MSNIVRTGTPLGGGGTDYIVAGIPDYENPINLPLIYKGAYSSGWYWAQTDEVTPEIGYVEFTAVNGTISTTNSSIGISAGFIKNDKSYMILQNFYLFWNKVFGIVPKGAQLFVRTTSNPLAYKSPSSVTFYPFLKEITPFWE